MPIKFSCVKCQKAFTVADSAAGKQGRCKDCGYLNTIPHPNAGADRTAAAVPAAVKAAATYEVTSAINGSVFGPADSKTLKQWVKEDRITADCQIKKVGTATWKPAKQLFPQLAQAAPAQAAPVEPVAEVGSHSAQPTPDAFANFKGGGMGATAAGTASSSGNPYAAGTTVQKKLLVSGDVVPTAGDVGFIIGHAFEAFKKNWGLAIGGVIINFILVFVTTGVIQAFPVMLGEVGLVIGGVLFFPVVVYFAAGLMNLFLRLGRMEEASLGDLFNVGDRILPLTGFGFLAGVAVTIPLVILVGVMAVAGNALGAEGAMIASVVFFLAIFVFSLLVTLLFWPCYFLIVDRKAKVIEAIGLGMKIGSKNFLPFIAVYLVSTIVYMLGLLVLGVGALVSIPLAFLILVCAYLNMSGQIRR